MSNSQLNASRTSQDKTCNKNCKQLVEIMKLEKLIVINGRAQSDPPANYTYPGKSIIDLIWIDISALKLITDFTVMEEIIISNHMHCSLKLANFTTL